MVTSTLPRPERDPAYRCGAAALAAAAAIILAALAFEHIGGYRPCPLCLQQRYAYYAGIPLLFGALVLVSMGRRKIAAAIFALVAAAFLANAGLGVYHAGVEWKLWAGPQTCQLALEPLPTGQGGLLKQLETVRVIRCDEAPWQLLGLSFAGWNAVLSLLLSLGAFTASRLAWQRA
ncbi:MAG: disulfide bond formation protein B [Hyphomicrobiaceae bacterium]|nr:disulfide bond formation protein B [Hyphomicrobiaceae bacterium]